MTALWGDIHRCRAWFNALAVLEDGKLPSHEFTCDILVSGLLSFVAGRCSQGRFANHTGLSECHTCPAGRFSSHLDRIQRVHLIIDYPIF